MLLPKLPDPLNAQEQLLYGINKRLEILIELLTPKQEVIVETNKEELGDLLPVRKSTKRKA